MFAQDNQQQVSAGQDHLLLEWSAPERPFKQRSQEYFKTIAALVFLISIILFFAKEYLLIGAVLSVTFVAYALASVPPGVTKHRITTHGVENSGHFHRWEELRDFWFDDSHGNRLLVVHTYLSFPSRLFMLLDSADETKVRKLLSEHIPYRENPEKTALEKATQWIATKIPLEKPVA